MVQFSTFARFSNLFLTDNSGKILLMIQEDLKLLITFNPGNNLPHSQV
jgi:hypothetical protein